MREFNRRKKASISMEMLLSIILAVGVLFLVLGLFNNNLKDMTAHGGLNNLFRKSSATAYEQGAAFRQDSSKSYTNSQVNVKIVAEQGLQWYMDNTQAGIDSLYTTSLTTSLTANDQIDLIKYFTFKTILSSWGVTLSKTSATGASASALWPTTERNLAASNGINNGTPKFTFIINRTSESVPINSPLLPSKTEVTCLPINTSPTDPFYSEKEKVNYLKEIDTLISSQK